MTHEFYFLPVGGTPRRVEEEDLIPILMDENGTVLPNMLMLFDQCIVQTPRGTVAMRRVD